MSLYLVCECLITWLTINERARWEFPQSLLLTLTPDSYLHTPEKLQIGQLLGFRLGPAQRENRNGLPCSVGDFGNYCALPHSAEVLAKLFSHKQAGEEVQDRSDSYSASLDLWRWSHVKKMELRTAGFEGPVSSHTSQIAPSIWKE